MARLMKSEVRFGWSQRSPAPITHDNIWQVVSKVRLVPYINDQGARQVCSGVSARMTIGRWRCFLLSCIFEETTGASTAVSSLQCSCLAG